MPGFIYNKVRNSSTPRRKGCYIGELHCDGIFAGSSSSDQVHSRDVLGVLLRLTVAHNNGASIGVLLISRLDPTHTVSLSEVGNRPAIGEVLAYLEQRQYLA